MRFVEFASWIYERPDQVRLRRRTPTVSPEYRRKLRRNTAIAILGLGLVASSSVGWEWLSASLILHNPQQVQAQVTRSQPPDSDQALGTVYYSYMMGGKLYGGSFRSGVLATGTPVTVYCNPSYPWLSSCNEPASQRDDALGWMLVLAVLYAAMTAVALAVVSMVSLPSKTDPSDPGSVLEAANSFL